MAPSRLADPMGGEEFGLNSDSLLQVSLEEESRYPELLLVGLGKGQGCSVGRPYKEGDRVP
jgi:hypothetical protein